VSASADYTCAVTVRDTVVCWGALPSRTIGYQTWTGVAQVSAGVVAICAVTRDGALRCTGARAAGIATTGVHTPALLSVLAPSSLVHMPIFL